jgi:hypothetical protein
MSIKLEKNTYPAGHNADDFTCFGPPALKDGDFETVKIADLGCFTQDGKDSNKYYHAAIVKSKKDNTFYTYFEWGRTGAKNPNFQFVQCSSEAEAQREFVSQLMDKNAKRGEWITVAGNRVLRAKAGKDCYLVRAMATRSTGLPDAKTIKSNDGSKAKPVAEAVDKSAGKASSSTKRRSDRQTLELLRDLGQATVSYTRGSMADASLPTQTAIDEARTFLDEAVKRLKVTGDKVENQIKDNELVTLTSLMYGRIPKKKPLHCPDKDWILNADNIGGWRLDLDAFEAALGAEEQIEQHVADPLDGQPYFLEWVDPKSQVGQWLYKWWPQGSGNRHSHVGSMTIKNMWRIERFGDHALLTKAQNAIGKLSADVERPLYQPKERADLEGAESKLYRDTNTAFLFHGTRQVNVTGILNSMLRLPKQLSGVVITGAMFGSGCYWADDWRKSDGYTDGGYWSRNATGLGSRGKFMFVGDVVLGNPWTAPRSGGYQGPPKGHHCIFGKAGYSGVANNEWITFERNHMELRYVVEYTTR